MSVSATFSGANIDKPSGGGRGGKLGLLHLKPVATGSTRIIYAHPDDPDLLIKIMHPKVLGRHRSGPPWRRFRRGRVCKTFLREIREQLILFAHGESPGKFLQMIRGFVDTDAGYGMVVEALRDRDGGCAHTIKQLVAEGRFDSEARVHLDEFVDALLRSRIVIQGIHPGNLLYAYDVSGNPRFVLADGYGERALLPVTGWSDRLNRRSKVTNVRSFMAWLETELAGQATTRAA
jgi:hypothetical protein